MTLKGVEWFFPEVKEIQLYTCTRRSLDAKLLQSISYPKPPKQRARYRKAEKENCVVMINHINSPAEIIEVFQQSPPHT